jgi:lipopolysaccharide export LptBFGC system permease protein LptF
MLPGVVFAAGLAAGMWFIQERLMPQANVKQDILRAQIRGGGGVTRATVNLDKQWLASAETGRLYVYEFVETEKLLNPSVYEFDAEAVHLRRALSGREGVWTRSDEIEIKEVEMLDFKDSGISRQVFASALINRAEPPNVFKPTVHKPLHLSAPALSSHIKSIRKRGGETAQLAVSLQRKYAEPFSALIMALTGIPLALSFGRRSAVIALCLAVALGLLYWGAIGIFRQLGDYELLPPIVAAWAPILIFAAIGIYLLARSRT